MKKIKKVYIYILCLTLLGLTGCIDESNEYKSAQGNIENVDISANYVFVNFVGNSTMLKLRKSNQYTLDEIYEELKPLENKNVTIVYRTDLWNGKDYNYLIYVLKWWCLMMNKIQHYIYIVFIFSGIVPWFFAIATREEVPRIFLACMVWDFVIVCLILISMGYFNVYKNNKKWDDKNDRLL